MFPGSRIVDGGFQQTGIAIAVPKGRPAALAYVTKFLEEAKASGAVRRASTWPAAVGGRMAAVPGAPARRSSTTSFGRARRMTAENGSMIIPRH